MDRKQKRIKIPGIMYNKLRMVLTSFTICVEGQGSDYDNTFSCLKHCYFIIFDIFVTIEHSSVNGYNKQARGCFGEVEIKKVKGWVPPFICWSQIYAKFERQWYCTVRLTIQICTGKSNSLEMEEKKNLRLQSTFIRHLIISQQESYCRKKC